MLLFLFRRSEALGLQELILEAVLQDCNSSEGARTATFLEALGLRQFLVATGHVIGERPELGREVHGVVVHHCAHLTIKLKM